jgi:hypothetical protein
MTRNIFKSPAKRRNSEKWLLTHKSLIKLLNNGGPKVEPCGSPESTRKGEEEFPEVRTTENVYDK